MNLMNAIPVPAWAAGFKVVTSSCDYCHRSMPMRQISARKVGIRMGDRWYCSSTCFGAAAETKLAELLTSRRLEQTSRASRMPLGLSLMSRGLLTKEQLKEAMDDQKQTGEEIGELLVRQGTVNEDQVTAVRAAQWGCPVYTVPKNVVQDSIHIPSTLIRLYSAIPLHYVAATKLLLMGFVHGVDYGLLYAVEQVCGCKTQACFVTPSDFQSQLEAVESVQAESGDTAHREVTFEDLEAPAQMARTLCGYGVDLEAEEATIGKCKEFLWARLKCGPRDVDLLFNAV